MKTFLLRTVALVPLIAFPLCAQESPVAANPASEKAAPEKHSNEKPDAKADLPSAPNIIQRYLDVTGGTAAYDAVNTEVSTGTLSIAAAGINGTIEEFSAAPNRSYAVMTIPGVGKIEGGTDGKIAWENSVLQGARILSGDEAAVAMRKAATDAVTNWRKYYQTAKVTGTETVEGKSCYRVVMTPLKGSPETDFYDRDSGLLVKQSSVTDTPMGPVPSETVLDDYRKQGDVMLPFHIVQRMAGQQFDIKLQKIELNSDIPDSRFEPPAEIKALPK